MPIALLSKRSSKSSFTLRHISDVRKIHLKPRKRAAAMRKFASAIMTPATAAAGPNHMRVALLGSSKRCHVISKRQLLLRCLRT
eukprot:4334876-Lingulodinium_polyedra.AAC.1